MDNSNMFNKELKPNLIIVGIIEIVNFLRIWNTKRLRPNMKQGIFNEQQPVLSYINNQYGINGWYTPLFWLSVNASKEI